MPRKNQQLWTELTLEERRERPRLREKQREDSVKRSAKRCMPPG
jgi:hypothetical protein